jgi:hypothetical protein
MFFLTFLFTSCGNISNSNEERFSKKLDTSYKDNSTDIESITRTFYQRDKNIINQITAKVNDNLSLQQTIGEKEYTMIITEDRKTGVTLFEDNTAMLKLFDDMNTVLSNPGKSLRYEFGSLSNGEISSYGEDEISISIRSTLQDKRLYAHLNKAEIDSMKSCFLRYRAEK